MQPVSGLRFLVASAALVSAALAVGCTVENVNIRPAENESESTFIFGEVKNPTDGYAEVRVNGSLFDAGGNVVDSLFAEVCGRAIKPHETIPFRTSYRESTARTPIANYELHVDSTPTQPLPDASLAISDLRVEAHEPDYTEIAGTVTNTGSERYEGVTVCAAFYDSSGKVDGLLSGLMEDTIDPGRWASFWVHGAMVGGGPTPDAVTYRLWIGPEPGRLPSPGDRAPVSTDKLPLR